MYFHQKYTKIDLVVLPYYSTKTSGKELTVGVRIPFKQLGDEAELNPSVMCLLILLFHSNKIMLTMQLPPERRYEPVLKKDTAKFLEIDRVDVLMKELREIHLKNL